VQRLEHRQAFDAVDPQRLIFLDESAATTSMTRLYGRAPAGERALGEAPQSHWMTTTTIAAMNLMGILASLVFQGPTDGEAFGVFIEQVLGPKLRPGDIVVMDNLACHKSDRVREAIEARGAFVLLQPAYSPDLNPIEKWWSKMKSLLRSAGCRTIESLWLAIGQIMAATTAQDCQGFFASCGIAISLLH
jgi:transposase